MIIEYLEESSVVKYFENNVLPFVKETYEQDGIIDGPARREEFNNMTDWMCKEGIISEEMYNEICLPNHLDK